MNMNMTTTESLIKAFEILVELINKGYFDFYAVINSSYDERKEYLRDMINEYFRSGETNLCGMIDGSATSDITENINNFFKNELLVADIILLMDEEIYYEYAKEN